MPKFPDVTFIGQIPFMSPDEGDEEQNSFRDTPETDQGNAGYADQGRLGSYAPSNREPFGDAPGVKREAGYGASRADLERGYCEVNLRELPNYDIGSYKDRWTRPRQKGGSDIDDNPITSDAADYEFRRRYERSRGFFTRVKIPTDR